eukprot:5970994-Pleurochrysis_carterae.AAC.1
MFSQMVTIVVTTSPLPRHPCSHMLDEVLSSVLRHSPVLAKAPCIIVADGYECIQPSGETGDNQQLQDVRGKFEGLAKLTSSELESGVGQKQKKHERSQYKRGRISAAEARAYETHKCALRKMCGQPGLYEQGKRTPLCFRVPRESAPAVFLRLRCLSRRLTAALRSACAAGYARRRRNTCSWCAAAASLVPLSCVLASGHRLAPSNSAVRGRHWVAAPQVQHDRPMMRRVPLERIYAAMRAEPRLSHVRL